MPLTCPLLNFSRFCSGLPNFISSLVFSSLFLRVLPAAGCYLLLFCIYLACAKFSLNFWGSQNSCPCAVLCPGPSFTLSISLWLPFARSSSGWCPVINTSSDVDADSGWCGFNEQMISIFMRPLSVCRKSPSNRQVKIFLPSLLRAKLGKLNSWHFLAPPLSVTALIREGDKGNQRRDGVGLGQSRTRATDCGTHRNEVPGKKPLSGTKLMIPTWIYGQPDKGKWKGYRESKENCRKVIKRAGFYLALLLSL